MQKVFHAVIWEAVTAGVIALILGILYGALSASSAMPAHSGQQHILNKCLLQGLLDMCSTLYRSSRLVWWRSQHRTLTPAHR